ncbi:uncharacterized protein LOC117000800 isoform X3 [Catharus ustulatus]|nr:uncharacterized protein LOC117000800 isoform X3 [Catharus ustulatus]XP_032924719.1 uncharacterized protein LOC117000800 isoform X3 [Catharus ustulatus]
MSDFEYTPNLGDMIEIKREHDDHWALYVGDGYVIHGTPVAGSEKIVIKKITKELLKEVVGNDSWAVNNKYDQYCCPLPVQVIIRRAERCIDGELPYYVIDFKADGFVTKLRYGGQLRAFICGELHILGMSDFEYTPNLGDMIEIKREHDDHWALYVGDGYVIHGTPVAGSETIVIKKITKELLKEVVGTDSWAVNNKYDQYCCPLPVQVIIRRAERCIDGELPYYVIDFKADGFVTKLRYGGQLWCTVGSELLIPDMSHDKFKPNPGDMIEIKRTGYQHWALYMGRGYVIHMTPVDETIPSYSASNETTVILRIKKALLTVVARNDSWAVNNKYDQYRSPLPVEEIIKRAEGCIGKEMAYHVFDFKADDFVRKLRYGGQLMTFVGIELCIPDTIYDQIYPNPGDMVEIKQPGHHHWALYMGDGYVIHVTAVGENSLRVSTGSGTVHIRKLKVKKQLLADVARYETCCVNNKYDHYLTPCPVKEIIQRAEYWIGREWPYDVFSKHSEHFVTELRYGEAVSKQAFVDGGLHNLDMRDDEEYPKPGDLIEIDRGLYQHWALYVGHGYVIHVTPIGENSPPASASTMSFLLKVAKVKKELLDKAAGKDNWRVNNKYDDVLIPFPVEEIIRRAERQVGRIVLYFLLYKNCEHFVTKLRYGKAVSEQVEKINRSTAAGMGSIFGTAALAGIALLVI